MVGIFVDLICYCDTGRLLPRYEEESIVLSAAGARSARSRLDTLEAMQQKIELGDERRARNVSFGHGHDLVYELETRRITEIEFLFPKRNWVPLTHETISRPTAPRRGLALQARSAEVDGDALGEIRVVVRSRSEGDAILIDFGKGCDTGQTYELSERCFAVVGDEGELRTLLAYFS